MTLVLKLQYMHKQQQQQQQQQKWACCPGLVLVCFQLTVNIWRNTNQYTKIPRLLLLSVNEISGYQMWCLSVPVAVRSETWVCGCLLAGITGSNSTWSADVSCECCVLSRRGLCDGPIPRIVESYPVCVCHSVWLRMKDVGSPLSHSIYWLRACHFPFQTLNIAIRFWS